MTLNFKFINVISCLKTQHPFVVRLLAAFESTKAISSFSISGTTESTSVSHSRHQLYLQQKQQRADFDLKLDIRVDLEPTPNPNFKTVIEATGAKFGHSFLKNLTLLHRTIPNLVLKLFNLLLEGPERH